MIAPPLRASLIFPKCESLAHFSKLWSAVRPRVRVISPALGRPGSFLIMYLPSGVFCFSSMTSCSIFRPLTSEICLITTPSTSSPKEWPTELSRSGRAIARLPPHPASAGSLVDQAGAAGELGQAEHHELGRLDRRHADLADDLARVDALGRVGLLVALHVEGLGGGEPEQGALAPLVDQEGGDGAADLGPQGVVVRLEHHPLGAVQDRLLQVVEQAADAEVAPGRVAGQGAGAPDADAAAGEGAQAVDPDRVEQVVLCLGDLQLERENAAHHLVSGRLVDPAGVVAAAPDAHHVAAQRHEAVAAAGGVEHLHPKPVHGGVAGVVAGLVLAPLLDLL